MTAAATISMTLETLPNSGSVVAHYRWTQYQLTSTVDGQSSTSPLAAMTRTDAVAYAKKARTHLQQYVENFTGMKLSMVSGSYSETLTAHADDSEDGDGSPFIAETTVSGAKWRTLRHCARNFNMEARAARSSCKALQAFFLSVGC